MGPSVGRLQAESQHCTQHAVTRGAGEQVGRTRMVGAGVERARGGGAPCISAGSGVCGGIGASMASWSSWSSGGCAMWAASWSAREGGEACEALRDRRRSGECDGECGGERGGDCWHGGGAGGAEVGGRGASECRCARPASGVVFLAAGGAGAGSDAAAPLRRPWPRSWSVPEASVGTAGGGAAEPDGGMVLLSGGRGGPLGAAGTARREQWRGHPTRAAARAAGPELVADCAQGCCDSSQRR